MRIYVTKLVKYISFGFAGAITLYPLGVFVVNKQYLGYEDTINHEGIHWEQQKELYCLPFYLLYLYFWVTRFGYRRIPFEMEAYGNQNNMKYLKGRKKFAWKLY